MSAHFSSLYEQTAGLVQWSPDGRYVAMAVGQRLIIRDATDGFEIVQVCEVVSQIQVGITLQPGVRCPVLLCYCGWCIYLLLQQQ